MKYVVGDDPHGFIHVIVFGDEICHIDAAKAFGARIQTSSAGFVRKMQDGTWQAFGKSKTLNMETAPLDGSLLTFFLRDGLTGLDLMNMISYVRIQLEKRKAAQKTFLPLPPIPKPKVTPPTPPRVPVPLEQMVEIPMSEDERAAIEAMMPVQEVIEQ